MGQYFSRNYSDNKNSNFFEEDSSDDENEKDYLKLINEDKITNKKVGLPNKKALPFRDVTVIPKPGDEKGYHRKPKMPDLPLDPKYALEWKVYTMKMIKRHSKINDVEVDDVIRNLGVAIPVKIQTLRVYLDESTSNFDVATFRTAISILNGKNINDSMGWNLSSDFHEDIDKIVTEKQRIAAEEKNRRDQNAAMARINDEATIWDNFQVKLKPFLIECRFKPNVDTKVDLPLFTDTQLSAIISELLEANYRVVLVDKVKKSLTIRYEPKKDRNAVEKAIADISEDHIGPDFDCQS